MAQRKGVKAKSRMEYNIKKSNQHTKRPEEKEENNNKKKRTHIFWNDFGYLLLFLRSNGTQQIGRSSFFFLCSNINSFETDAFLISSIVNVLPFDLVFSLIPSIFYLLLALLCHSLCFVSFWPFWCVHLSVWTLKSNYFKGIIFVPLLLLLLILGVVVADCRFLPTSKRNHMQTIKWMQHTVKAKWISLQFWSFLLRYLLQMNNIELT